MSKRVKGIFSTQHQYFAWVTSSNAFSRLSDYTINTFLYVRPIMLVFESYDKLGLIGDSDNQWVIELHERGSRKRDKITLFVRYPYCVESDNVIGTLNHYSKSPSHINETVLYTHRIGYLCKKQPINPQVDHIHFKRTTHYATTQEAWANGWPNTWS